MSLGEAELPGLLERGLLPLLLYQAAIRRLSSHFVTDSAPWSLLQVYRTNPTVAASVCISTNRTGNRRHDERIRETWETLETELCYAPLSFTIVAPPKRLCQETWAAQG